jgi:hypothetical protein
LGTQPGPYGKRDQTVPRPQSRSETARTRASHTAEVPELLLDDAVQPFPIAQDHGLRTNDLEVITYDLVVHMH